MHAEDGVVHYGRDRQVIEDLRAVLPWIGIPILSQTLIVEAVDLCGLPRLVVAADEGDAAWVHDLQHQEQFECLHTVVSSIHEVSHKNIILTGNLPTDVEQL
eukprot:CAMPEP_0170576478 /NCGR_PEP_ID=MMETSP0224-20130122/4414_1 /TAXON_ID=285029 /ORGANISM="Togula jolla, Strain CCCM 725" /LENGTH=101 /DNA_ID=CAMNT_0010899323 /DNA_START=251 /DNA_END=556 /DNA_ORIENTATION=-